MKKQIAALFLIVACIYGCGGGGTTTGGTAATPGQITITGTASLGIIKGSTVKAYRITTDNLRIYLAETRTNNLGWYSLSFTRPDSPVVIEVSGGEYVDEATGITVRRSENDILHAVVSSVGSATQIAVTPLTELAYQLSGSPLTATSIDTANSVVSDAFNFDIIRTQPVEPTLNGFRHPTTEEQRSYALALAALSQQTLDLPGATMNTSLEGYRNDLYLDGRISLAVATTFQTSLSRFLGTALTPNPRNHTGVTTPTSALASFGTVTIPVKLNTRGTFASGSFIEGVQLQLRLPIGVSIPDTSVIKPSGQAAMYTTIASAYYPGTRTISTGIMNTEPGFGLGEFMTIYCDVLPDAALNFSDFVISVTEVSGDGGDGSLTNYINVFITL